MNKEQKDTIVKLFKSFKKSEDYQNRLNQFKVTDCFREIIKETLKNKTLKNEHLTGFIQMFKYGCSDEIFDKYLDINISDNKQLNKIKDKVYSINEYGYTGAGLNSVRNLTPSQLKSVKEFIEKAFTIRSVSSAISLCADFEKLNIPLVKSGIYSPWLYYINPKIFPILNNSHSFILGWLEQPKDYPSNISILNEIKELVKEQELGTIDLFAHKFGALSGLEITLKPISDNDKINKNMTEQKTQKTPLNQILFGPPGTGKTYNTINKALEITGVNISNLDRNKIKEEFDKKRKEGQIEFTTFHQSMSYEEFIEGIKPVIKESEADDEVIETSTLDYAIKPGIFKKLVQKAQNKLEVKADFDDLWVDYIENLRAYNKEKIFKSVQSEMKFERGESSDTTIMVRYKKSYDPANAEGIRPFIVSKNAIKKLWEVKIDGSETNLNGRKEAAEIHGSGRATHIYAVYKDFYQYAQKAGALNSTSETKNYVLIIDEINRGNVSQIFGELITLIEEDKRLGKDEALEVTLPYSKEKFGVPPNLYIIGTMNTADRSVEALDTALRRRFSFTEMPPLYKLKELDYPYAGTTGKVILQTINKRIEKLLDRDHLIGHSYFIKQENEEAETKLMDSFYRNIIPLLQEYFFGDYAKIGAVLGSGFVHLENDNEVIFGEGFDNQDLGEKQVYQIIDYRKNEPGNQYVQNEMTFENAIKKLINISEAKA